MPTEIEFFNKYHKRIEDQWDHPYCDDRGRVMESRLNMETKIGRYLLPIELVHHHYLPNGDFILFLCKDRKEHKEVHRMEEAERFSGHCDWLKCVFCKQYDDPKNITITPSGKYHKSCYSSYRKQLRRKNAER